MLFGVEEMNELLQNVDERIHHHLDAMESEISFHALAN